MKKTILSLILGILLVPFVSAFIAPDEPAYTPGELANAVQGNNLFFGALILIGIIVLAVYIFFEVKKFKSKGKK